METLTHPIVDYLKKTGEQSTYVAIASFLVGTALFATYKLGNESENLVIMGFFFVVIAAFINLLVLANLAILFCLKRHYRAYFAVKMLIVTANIPITFIYLQAM